MGLSLTREMQRLHGKNASGRQACDGSGITSERPCGDDIPDLRAARGDARERMSIRDRKSVTRSAHAVACHLPDAGGIGGTEKPAGGSPRRYRSAMIW